MNYTATAFFLKTVLFFVFIVPGQMLGMKQKIGTKPSNTFGFFSAYTHTSNNDFINNVIQDFDTVTEAKLNKIFTTVSSFLKPEKTISEENKKRATIRLWLQKTKPCVLSQVPRRLMIYMMDFTDLYTVYPPMITTELREIQNKKSQTAYDILQEKIGALDEKTKKKFQDKITQLTLLFKPTTTN